VGRRPGSLAGVTHILPKQQCLEPVAGIALRADGVVPRPQQVADGLIFGIRHADGTQFIGPRQAGQLDGIAPVGLDPFPWPSRCQRGRHHRARDPACCEVPVEGIPARPGLVHHLHARYRTPQARQCRIQRRQVPADPADVANLATSSIRRRNLDRFLVNVQPDVQSGTVAHGLPPRKFSLPSHRQRCG
jgi:hypothetical protein